MSIFTGIAGALGSNDAFTQARLMRRQRIQDALGKTVRRGSSSAQRKFDSLFNRGARGERNRQRMLAAGAAPSIAEGEMGTSQVSGIMEGAQASGGLIGAASSAAAAQQPVQSESLAPADRKAAFDAGIRTVDPMAGMTVFGANQTKVDAMNNKGFDPYNTFDDDSTTVSDYDYLDEYYDEKRQDLDGRWYTRRQFYNFYGSDEAWDNLDPNIYHNERFNEYDGKWYTKEEFFQWYGSDKIWKKMSPKKRLKRMAIERAYWYASYLPARLQDSFLRKFLDTY